MALDPQAVALAKAIREVESGGNMNAKGASGESGGYQFMPSTWKSWAGKYLGDPNAQMDKINQNKVAYYRIKERKDAGLTAAQIASEWNSGKADAYKQNWKGVNSQGVAYDTPAYVGKVKQAYQKYKPVQAAATPSVSPAPSKGLAEKTTDFLGATKFGKALGATAAVLTGSAGTINDAAIRGAEADRQLAELLNKPGVSAIQKERIRKQLAQRTGQAPQTASEAMPELSYTPKEVYGSALQTAANILPIPIGKATSAMGKIGKAAISGAGTGALLAGGRAAEENKDIGGIASSAIKGAAGGAILGGALSGVGQTVKPIVSGLSKTAGKIAGSALKETVSQTKKSIRYGGNTLGDTVVKRGFVGTDKQIYDKALSQMDAAENRLQNVLKPNTNIIMREEILSSGPIKSLISRMKKTPGMKDEAEKIISVIAEMPKSMKLTVANERKRLIYRQLGDPAYKLDASLSGKREAQKAVAQALKKLIEDKSAYTAGKGTVRKLNQDLAEVGKIRDAALDNIVRKERNQIIGLGDYGGIGAGALLGGAPGAAAGVLVRKLAGSTWGKTAGAALLNRIAKAISDKPNKSAQTIVDKIKKIPIASLRGMSDVALKNLIAELAST